VRFNHFAGKAARLLTTLIAAAALVVAPSASPAFALGAAPRTAPEFNGGVYAIAYRGSTVFVGGSFTSAVWGGRAYARQRLAAFDSRTGALLSWNPSADSTVRALAINGATVYAAGDFHYLSGWRRDAVASLDASSGAVGSFAHTVTGTPYALTISGGRLYLGGRFDSVDGDRRANLAAFSLAGGRLDSGWRPSADDAVHTMAASGARIYAGGPFESVNDVTGTRHVVAISAVGGAVNRAFLPRPEYVVDGIAVDRTGVYVATGGQGGRVLAYTAGGALRWQRVFDGDAVTVATLNGITYVGGHFDHACLTVSNGAHGQCSEGSVPRVKLAAVTAAGVLTSWAPQANGVIGVRVLGVDTVRGTITAGGDFTMMGGQIRRRFASFG
jgi:hypothetical protein